MSPIAPSILILSLPFFTARPLKLGRLCAIAAPFADPFGIQSRSPSTFTSFPSLRGLRWSS